MPTNVILVGMMGSGKSTVGKLVADRTGREFIDLDAMIEKSAGKKTARRSAARKTKAPAPAAPETV